MPPTGSKKIRPLPKPLALMALLRAAEGLIPPKWRRPTPNEHAVAYAPKSSAPRN
jgi:hypothetical protein